MRHGSTLIEGLVAAAVLALALGILQGVLGSASRGTARAVEAGDAIRSVAIASDRIRHDVSRMVFQTPARDLSIAPDGRRFAVRVPRPRGADLWWAEHDPVTYSLEPVRGRPGAHRLVRQDARGAAPVGGCYLADMTVALIPAGAPDRFFLQVTLAGAAAGSARGAYASSMLLPLTRMDVPSPILFAEVPL